MDLTTFLQIVLNRGSALTIDLTSSRPPPVYIDLTRQSNPQVIIETPMEQQIEIFLHLTEFDQNSERVHRRHKGLSKKRVNSLGCWRVRKSKKTAGLLVIDNDIPVRSPCPVCLEEFKEASVVRYLKCKHFYHKQCIDTWLGENDSCPMDRLSLK